MSHLFAPNRRNIEFHELFKNIPQDELLIDSYSCALSREILIHGRLYLSANFACFNANILGWVTNIVLNLNDIVAIEKKMTALIIPNGITLSTLHTRHVYASFMKRDDAYNKLCRVWKNCISDQPLPTTELLYQIASGKFSVEAEDESVKHRRFRERRISSITDNGIESIMSDDYSFSDDLDPALTVRREYNFGSCRQKVLSYKNSEATLNLCDDYFSSAADESIFKQIEPDLDHIETEEEQKEVRESILPCSCAFHYKDTIVDQLVLVSFSSIMEGLLFARKGSLSCVPRAFQLTLKELDAREVKFSPWKIYMGKWERRIWTCVLPAKKLLLHDALLSIKVTDSIIIRSTSKICVESLMQIDGVPGGGSFVKWKLCATAPSVDSAASEQCRITITAAAASPLGSWFKDSIRSALIHHVEELWTKAIRNAATIDYSDDSNSDKSLSLSRSAIRSTDSFSKLILPQNFQNSFNSITLTYFDRKSFFLSITRISLILFVLFISAMIGNRLIKKDTHAIDFNTTLKHGLFKKYSDSVQKEYHTFVENNLNLRQNYPEILNQAANEFNILNGQLTEIVGQVFRIQQDIGDQWI